ncbi:hypothetical protein ACXYMU_04220 [Pontibacter sp. CAU 1760]
MAEIELSVLVWESLNRRIGNMEGLEREVLRCVRSVTERLLKYIGAFRSTLPGKSWQNSARK